MIMTIIIVEVVIMEFDSLPLLLPSSTHWPCMSCRHVVPGLSSSASLFLTLIIFIIIADNALLLAEHTFK